MNILKSHFWYHKRQRNGIFFLVILIIGLLIVQHFVAFTSDEKSDVSSSEILAFQKQIDSLKKIEVTDRKPKIYPFNPNYISDQKGYQLGMSILEIDRLHLFRKTNKYVNSVREFKQITKVSDSLLKIISPYFKFPDWVVKRNQKLKNHTKSSLVSNKNYSINKVRAISTNNINLATAKDFEIVNGVGEKLAKRIVTYRNKLQGYSLKEQLYEVWYLERGVADRILNKFSIIEPPKIEKINVNTATFKEVLSNPYIDFELCKKIFEYRDEVAELQSISELTNIKNFPLDKYARIILYLTAE